MRELHSRGPIASLSRQRQEQCRSHGGCWCESLPLGVALESESASQDDAAFVSSMGEADVTTEPASNHTWPDFSETQARDFQQWFSDKLKSKRKVAIKSVQWLAEEGEKAEAQGDIAAARRSLAKAGEIHKAAEEPFNTEHMRQESQVFFRELQRLRTALVFF